MPESPGPAEKPAYEPPALMPIGSVEAMTAGFDQRSSIFDADPPPT